MTGRIKLLENDKLIQNATNLPELLYVYDMPSEFDEQCGTFGLAEFQLPHPECPERFVCDVPDNNADIAQFSKCIEAMDCHMLVGMTTNIESQSAIALFVHQMVPHHQNAVNMAKALLKTGKVVCDDLTEESDACVTEVILREIVNNQNFQIQAMYGIVDKMGYPKEDDCQVLIGDGLKNATAAPTPGPTPGLTSAAINFHGMTGIIMLAIATLFML
jgi:hypothetical protein